MTRWRARRAGGRCARRRPNPEARRARPIRPTSPAAHVSRHAPVPGPSAPVSPLGRRRPGGGAARRGGAATPRDGVAMARAADMQAASARAAARGRRGGARGRGGRKRVWWHRQPAPPDSLGNCEFKKSHGNACGARATCNEDGQQKTRSTKGKAAAWGFGVVAAAAPRAWRRPRPSTCGALCVGSWGPVVAAGAGGGVCEGGIRVGGSVGRG